MSSVDPFSAVCPAARTPAPPTIIFCPICTFRSSVSALANPVSTNVCTSESVPTSAATAARATAGPPDCIICNTFTRFADADSSAPAGWAVAHSTAPAVTTAHPTCHQRPDKGLVLFTVQVLSRLGRRSAFKADENIEVGSVCQNFCPESDRRRLVHRST